MSLFKPNLVSVTYYLWLIGMIFIGLNLSILGVRNYAHDPASERSLYLAYYSTSYTLIFMPLSMIFFQKYLFGGAIRSKIINFYQSRLIPFQSVRDSGQIIFWVCCTVVSALAVFYCYYVVPSAPLFALIKGKSVIDVLQLRNEVKFDFPGIIYIKNIFALMLTPIVSYVVYGYYKLYGGYKYRGWFYFTVLLSILALTFHGSKAPILIYFLTLFVIRGIVKKSISKKLFVYAGLATVSFVFVLFSMFNANLVFNFYAGPLSRIFMVPSAGLRLSFDTFPEIHPFLFGGSFPGWITNIFGMEHERSARILMKVYNPEAVETGTAGVMNSLFIAEAWANFGLVGMLLAPVIVGFVVQFLHNFLSSRKKTPIFVAMMGMFMFELPILGGFVDFLWNVGWLFLFTVVYGSVQSRQILVGAVKQSKIERS